MKLNKNEQVIKIVVEATDTYLLTLLARGFCLATHAKKSYGIRANRAERLLLRNKETTRKYLTELLGDRLHGGFGWEFRNHMDYNTTFDYKDVHKAYDKVCHYRWTVTLTSDLTKKNDEKRIDTPTALKNWANSVRTEDGFNVGANDMELLFRKLGVDIVEV